MDTFLLKLTQCEKTRSIGKTLILLGNLIINFDFRNKKSITFFATFTIFLFNSGFCLPFNNRNTLNLKKKSQVKPRKIKIEREQNLGIFPEKQICKTYIRVLTTSLLLKIIVIIFF